MNERDTNLAEPHKPQLGMSRCYAPVYFGSFFSGIEGFGFAAKSLGWINTFHVEIDEYCQKVIKQNFKNSEIYGDIRTTDFTKYKGTIDVVSGGFPCQNISISGSGEGIYGAKSGLWSEYYRAIKEIMPKCVVIENSPELLKKGFEQIICDFSEIGYDIEWQCFCASDFGYDHQRERLFAIAYPAFQRRRGLLYMLKRSIIEKNKKKIHWIHHAILFYDLNKGLANPRFSEWMMGYPKDWTLLKD